MLLHILLFCIFAIPHFAILHFLLSCIKNRFCKLKIPTPNRKIQKHKIATLKSWLENLGFGILVFIATWR
ncbi:hypothetical protein BKN38_08145 [Helicobacter sp. CLO-3]|nr:hypothetical protein BA723_08155 [Helicobacter sp. CLO-3]OHU81855.1 hypothetical protein BKN38_08145 [Helicobacter sp. CLO-3]